MLCAIIVLAVSQTTFAVAMGLTIGPRGRATAYPQLLVAQRAMGHTGMLLMLGATALTAVNTFNGGFVTLSRFMYAVAREGKLPRALARLNNRAAPVLPVWILGISSLVLAVVVAVTGSWVIVVSVCAALEMMIYATAGYVVWRLRQRQADTERSLRIARRPPDSACVRGHVRPASTGQQRHRREADQRGAAVVPARGSGSGHAICVQIRAPPGET
jgi:amino acid transporter